MLTLTFLTGSSLISSISSLDTLSLLPSLPEPEVDSRLAKEDRLEGEKIMSFWEAHIGLQMKQVKIAIARAALQK